MPERAKEQSAKRKLSAKQIGAVLKVDGPARNDHVVKQVVDWEVAWGLYDEGWAVGADDDGTRTFPSWRAWEYAELRRAGSWSGYKPEAISLEESIEELLPKLRMEGILASVMPAIEQLLEDLKMESTRYE